MNTRLKIAKLADPADTANIAKALEAVPRVKSATLKPAEHEAVIDHDGADVRELAQAVKRVGYLATVDVPRGERVSASKST